jgi:hypothetical protein
MHVALLFQKLLARIRPPAGELFKARAHAATIKTRLENSFKLRKFVVVGSHSRGSAVRSYSDFDCFAVVSHDDARWGGVYTSSFTVLDRLRAELASRLPRTPVSRDQQAAAFGSARFSAWNRLASRFDGRGKASGIKPPGRVEHQAGAQRSSRAA